jgi:hypothetical protein
VKNCAERSPLIFQDAANSQSLPHDIEWFSQIHSIVNARKYDLISESEITTSMKSFLLNDSNCACLIRSSNTILSSFVQSAEHSCPAVKIDARIDYSIAE